MFNSQDVHTLYFDWIVPRAAVPAANNNMSKSAVGLVTSFAQLAVQGPVVDSDWIKATRKIVKPWVVRDDKIMEGKKKTKQRRLGPVDLQQDSRFK